RHGYSSYRLASGRNRPALDVLYRGKGRASIPPEISRHKPALARAIRRVRRESCRGRRRGGRWSYESYRSYGSYGWGGLLRQPHTFELAGRGVDQRVQTALPQPAVHLVGGGGVEHADLQHAAGERDGRGRAAEVLGDSLGPRDAHAPDGLMASPQGLLEGGEIGRDGAVGRGPGAILAEAGESGGVVHKRMIPEARSEEHTSG